MEPPLPPGIPLPLRLRLRPDRRCQQASNQLHPTRDGYTFLNAPEAAFIEAFVDVIVPADELTPSGTALGLATFIDRQLAGAWGKGDRLYRQGPWKEGSPGQGYQLPLTPAEFFRAGIDAVNRHCKEVNGKEFDRLTAADKQKVLEDLDKGTIALDHVSGKQFFDSGVSGHDGRSIRRSDLWRQSQQSSVENDRLSGRDRHSRNEHHDVPE